MKIIFFIIFVIYIKRINTFFQNKKKNKDFFYKKKKTFFKKIIFFVKNQNFFQKNTNFWSWKIGFFEKNFFFWNICKFVGNRQNEKKIIKIKSSNPININSYPKWYYKANSRWTMLDLIDIMFFNP